MAKSKEIVIDGVKYVPEGTTVEADTLDGLEYKIIRTYSAGVFAGYLESLDEATQVAVVRQARRLWYWSGAASLSQLSVDGVNNPRDCKFPTEVAKVKLLQVVEVLDCTAKAQKSIKSVEIWSA